MFTLYIQNIKLDGPTRHKSQLYIPLLSITLAGIARFLPIDKILAGFRLGRRTISYFLVGAFWGLDSSLARPASRYLTHSSCRSTSRSAAFILSFFRSSRGNFWRLRMHR